MLISGVDSCLLVAHYPIKLSMELSLSENELDASQEKNIRCNWAELITFVMNYLLSVIQARSCPSLSSVGMGIDAAD